MGKAPLKTDPDWLASPHCPPPPPPPPPPERVQYAYLMVVGSVRQSPAPSPEGALYAYLMVVGPVRLYNGCSLYMPISYS